MLFTLPILCVLLHAFPLVSSNVVRRAVIPTRAGQIGVNPVDTPYVAPATNHFSLDKTTTHWIGVNNVDPSSVTSLFYANPANGSPTPTAITLPFIVEATADEISIVPNGPGADELIDALEAACGEVVGLKKRQEDQDLAARRDAGLQGLACVQDFIDQRIKPQPQGNPAPEPDIPDPAPENPIPEPAEVPPELNQPNPHPEGPNPAAPEPEVPIEVTDPALDQLMAEIPGTVKIAGVSAEGPLAGTLVGASAFVLSELLWHAVAKTKTGPPEVKIPMKAYGNEARVRTTKKTSTTAEVSEESFHIP